MSSPKMTTAAFESALEQINGGTERKSSIGTYYEKTLHAVLKHCYEPDENYHEIPNLGYIADIKNESCIIEIQTSGFHRLKQKLAAFLPVGRVVVVYPLPSTKWLVWVDKETGEVTKKRKSPKQGSLFDAVRELYTIREYIMHPNFELRIVLFDIEEHRYLDGWSSDKRRGSSRAERYPINFVQEYTFGKTQDFLCFFPEGLPTEFSAKDFAAVIKRNASVARLAINILRLFGHIEIVRKDGNTNIFSKKKTTAK